VDGVDATEKLCVLIRHFGRLNVHPDDVETVGIRHVTSSDLAHAWELGGTLKPIVHAEWSGSTVSAYGGPAFVPAGHPLGGLLGTGNGVCLKMGAGATVYFSGPGAGPDITAITVLDDVMEAIAEVRPIAGWRADRACRFRPLAMVHPPDVCHRPAKRRDIADLLGAHGVWLRRTSTRDGTDGRDSRWLLTYACARPQIEAALSMLSHACGCTARLHRALETSDE
jgi:homoserine dehydrogenase